MWTIEREGANMRHDQRADDALRTHTEDLAAAAGRNQPARPDERGPTEDPPTRPEGFESAQRQDAPGWPEPAGQPRADAGESWQEPVGEPRAQRDEPDAMAGTADAAPRPAEDGAEPERMFRHEDAERIRAEWQRIQTGFVDDPHDAVRSANQLLSEALRSLTAAVDEMEGQWRQGSGGQTEDLRQKLRHYRTVLDQLLDA
jgi:hypothetical protein